MITSRNKKVSVVVPNYNYSKYIGRRIDSIMRQTYPIYELIVLDDCSTDNSVDVIEKKLVEVRENHPEVKISFVKNEKNSGKAIAQWKKGFELATGDYVWIAEADDLSSRKFLEEVMRGFDASGVVLSYAESAIINSWGLMIAPNFRWSRDKEKTGHYKDSYVKEGKKEIEEILAIRCTIPNVSSVVFKKDKKVLEYLDEALRFTQVGDWYFYTKVLENGKISYDRRALNRFRVHKGSVTNDSKKAKRHYDEIIEAHDYFKKNYELSDMALKRMQAEEKRVAERIRG